MICNRMRGWAPTRRNLAIGVALLALSSACSGSDDGATSPLASAETEMATDTSTDAADAGSPGVLLSGELDADEGTSGGGVFLDYVNGDLADSCPVTRDTSTADVLVQLTESLGDDDQLASQLGQISAAFDDGRPSGEQVVEAMAVLPRAIDRFAETASPECVRAVRTAIGPYTESPDFVSPGAETTSPAGQDDLVTLLERQYDLTSEDATCVAGKLSGGSTSDGNEGQTVDDIAFLAAMSACANGL